VHPLEKGSVIDVEYVKSDPNINRPVNSASEETSTLGVLFSVLLAVFGVAMFLWPNRVSKKQNQES
jgi:hypothetical protein